MSDHDISGAEWSDQSDNDSGSEQEYTSPTSFKRTTDGEMPEQEQTPKRARKEPYQHNSGACKGPAIKRPMASKGPRSDRPQYGGKGLPALDVDEEPDWVIVYKPTGSGNAQVCRRQPIMLGQTSVAASTVG